MHKYLATKYLSLHNAFQLSRNSFQTTLTCYHACNMIHLRVFKLFTLAANIKPHITNDFFELAKIFA